MQGIHSTTTMKRTDIGNHFGRKLGFRNCHHGIQGRISIDKQCETGSNWQQVLTIKKLIMLHLQYKKRRVIFLVHVSRLRNLYAITHTKGTQM